MLDTNTVSELSKPRPNGRVVSFFLKTEPQRAWISVLTIGEFWKGVAQRAKRDSKAAARLGQWAEQAEMNFGERILPVTKDIAHLWGELSSQRTRPAVDTLLAATALHHGLTLVSRNTRDMEDTGATLFNPWEDPDLD